MKGASGARQRPRQPLGTAAHRWCCCKHAAQGRLLRAAAAWGAPRLGQNCFKTLHPCRPPPPPLAVASPLQEDIEKVRDPSEQMSRMGVPEQHVNSGHAFHTYTLTSPDGSGEQQLGCLAAWLGAVGCSGA